MVKFVGRNSYKPPENMPLQRQVVKEMMGQVVPVYRGEFGRYVGIYRKGMPSLQVERGNRPWLYVSANGGDSTDREGLEEALTKEVDAALERISNRVEALLRAHKDSDKVYWDIGLGRITSTYIRPYRGIYTCPECKTEVEDTFSIFKAGRTPACEYKHELVVFSEAHFEQPLHLKAPRVVFERAGKAISRASHKDRRAFRVAEELNLCAKKEEESNFLSLDLDRFSRGEDRLYFLQEQKIPVGYILWNDEQPSGLPTARQLFVQPEYRKRGNGTLLMQETVGAEVGEGEFGAETPNEHSIGIMLRLGYAEETPEGIKGKRVRFVASGC